MNGVEQKQAAFAALHHQIQIIDDLLGGTATMRQARQRHLYKMELESEDAYKNRLNRSTLYPALPETLGQMTGRVFFKPIVVSEIHEKLQTDFLPDVDMQGNNLDVFASRWFRAGLAYGVSYLLVDYTQTNNARTLAEEKASGARPYFVHILASQVLGIRTATINGQQKLIQFRYKENVVELDGEFGEKTVEQICVYEIGKVRKFRQTENGFVEHEVVELKAQNRSLDFIPIVAFSTKDTGFMLGEPPLMELAYLNIKHWQSQSDQDNILNTARVPLLGIFSDEEMKSLTLGGSAIQVGKDAKIAYIEHSGNAINAGQESLKELESQMRVAGAKLLDKTVLAMTDSQARDEQGKEISLLRLYANKFEDAVDTALEYVGKWLGLNEIGNVEISGNIDNDFDPASSMDIIVKLQTAGTISKQTAFEEAKRRGLLSDNLEWEDEQARLDSEGLNNDELDFQQKPDD